MYFMNSGQYLLELLNCVMTILQVIPVSYKNDYNHRIRKLDMWNSINI